MKKTSTRKELKKIKSKANKIKKVNKVKSKKNGNLTRKRRMRVALIVSCTVFFALGIRIAWIQFYRGSELQSMAYIQQTLDRKISPKRGTIFDRNGYELAVSSTVYTITVNPVIIKEEDKEKVSKILSDIFGLDYEKTLKKVKKRSSIETIARRQEKDVSGIAPRGAGFARWIPCITLSPSSWCRRTTPATSLRTLLRFPSPRPGSGKSAVRAGRALGALWARR